MPKHTPVEKKKNRIIKEKKIVRGKKKGGKMKK